MPAETSFVFAGRRAVRAQGYNRNLSFSACSPPRGGRISTHRAVSSRSSREWRKLKESVPWSPSRSKNFRPAHGSSQRLGKNPDLRPACGPARLVPRPRPARAPVVGQSGPRGVSKHQRTTRDHERDQRGSPEGPLFPTKSTSAARFFPTPREGVAVPATSLLKEFGPAWAAFQIILSGKQKRRNR